MAGRWTTWPPDLPSTPPPWEEQEWCDGGATCWHEECIAWVEAQRELDEDERRPL